MPGATLHFDLQYGFASDPTTTGMVPFTLWYNFAQVDAITNQNGVATALLPVDLGYPLGLTSVDPTTNPVQILATFDGAAGILPRHAASPLQVSAPPAGVPEAPAAILLVVVGGLVALILRRARHRLSGPAPANSSRNPVDVQFGEDKR
jgi:hypothetical protein